MGTRRWTWASGRSWPSPSTRAAATRACLARGPISYRPAPPRHFFSVLSLVRNEGSILHEWAEHYLSEGADHLFLVDDGNDGSSFRLARLSSSNSNGGSTCAG